jgi:di/tricarboxylate transporter
VEEKAEKVEARKLEEPWQIKEGLIIVPFLASALALTWEVGFFLRIKGSAFGLFTLSEHLTFALQALPLALLAAIGVVGGAVQSSLMDRFISRDWLRGSGGRLVLAVVSLMMVGVAVHTYFYSRSALLIAMALFALALAAVGTLAPILKQRRFLFLLMVVVGLFSCTFCVGIDSARNELRSARPLNRIKVGEKIPKQKPK